ncbi:DinB family protein [Gracilibacillus xinjiangensis]|uniref:DinB family protein n=1 Tax=Gracilibacillus xinjiangensis TaxID=1193282 RepID=A0ABV8WXI2_9BACI
MIYDLPGDTNMSPIVGMLYAAVKENSERLRLITNGMSQEEVDFRGQNNNFNSTAQLITHITYVDLNWIFRIRDQSLPLSLIEDYGPMLGEDNRLPMVEGVSLNTLLTKREKVLGMLRDACIQLKDEELDRVVAFGHENEKLATIRWGLWHMADHNRYHQAHINQLRKWYN